MNFILLSENFIDFIGSKGKSVIHFSLFGPVTILIIVLQNDLVLGKIIFDHFAIFDKSVCSLNPDLLPVSYLLIPIKGF